MLFILYYLFVSKQFIHCLENVLKQRKKIVFMEQNPVLVRYHDSKKYTLPPMTLNVI